MRVSITGATGFVGWHTAQACLARGWSVRAIVRPGRRKPLPPGIDAAPAELAPNALSSAIEGSDAVVHCAGLIRARDEQTLRRVNVDGTRAVVDAANRTGARVVLISSQAAGGPGTIDHPRREADPSEPVNAYGRSKVAAEQIVREECRTGWCILRPCAVYGERDRGFLPLFQMAARGLFLLVADPAMPFTVIDVRDLAHGIALATERQEATGATLFLGHPEPRTTQDILQAIAASLGRPYRPRRVPTPLFRLAATAGEAAWRFGVELPVDRSRYAEFTADGFVCDVSRAREALGFTAETAFADGIQRTANWYRENGWLPRQR